MNAKFPYTVKQSYAQLKDERCCYQISDHTGFHFFRCPKPATKKIDEVGLCGVHARSIKIWRRKINNERKTEK